MKKTTAAVAAITALVMGSTAFATMDIMKEYKKDKDPKATCASCHKAKTPKKGDAELNALGDKVKAAKGKDGKIDWSKVPAAEEKK
jgi:cytochrome c553